MDSKKDFTNSAAWKNRVPVLIGAVLIVSVVAAFLASYFMPYIRTYFGSSLIPVLLYLAVFFVIFVFIVLPVLQKKLQKKAEENPDKPWPKIYQIFLGYFVIFLIPVFFGREVVEYLAGQGLPPYFLPLFLLGFALLVGLIRGFLAMLKKE